MKGNISVGMFLPSGSRPSRSSGSFDSSSSKVSSVTGEELRVFFVNTTQRPNTFCSPLIIGAVLTFYMRAESLQGNSTITSDTMSRNKLKSFPYSGFHVQKSRIRKHPKKMQHVKPRCYFYPFRKKKSLHFLQKCDRLQTMYFKRKERTEGDMFQPQFHCTSPEY